MNENTRTDRVTRYFAACVCLMTLAVLAPGIAHSSGSRVIVHRTDVQVRAAQGCERNLDRDRSPHATRRTYSSSTSVPFRRWAFKLWRDRAAHACSKVSYLNAYPPRAISYVFSRIGQEATALLVAQREGGGGYCTRAWNPAGYAGCFQMGPWARTRYGHGPTALDQSWAAFAYVRDARGWCSGWSATAWGC